MLDKLAVIVSVLALMTEAEMFGLIETENGTEEEALQKTANVLSVVAETLGLPLDQIPVPDAVKEKFTWQRPTGWESAED